MIIKHIILGGLFYGAVLTGYLLCLMAAFSPRVWGYKDYPEIVKKKVPAQIRKEKTLGAVVGIPWILFALAYPVYSTFVLKAKLGGNVSFLAAFLNMSVLYAFATLGDLVLIDWFIISKITPNFVVIPGSSKEDYKDFSHHFRAHARSAVVWIFISLITAGIASIF